MSFRQVVDFLTQMESAVPETHDFCADSFLSCITFYGPSIIVTIVKIGVGDETGGYISPIDVVGNNTDIDRQKTNGKKEESF